MWNNATGLTKPVSRAFESNSLVESGPIEQASNMRAKCQVPVNMHRDLLQMVYANVSYVVTNCYYTNGTCSYFSFSYIY